MVNHNIFSIKLLITLPGLLLAFACIYGAGLSSSNAAELLAADRATNRILAFDATTGTFSRVLVDSGLDVPTALVMGPGGYLYVSNLQSGEVLKVDPASGAVSLFASGLNGPGGLAYDVSTDTLMVSEFGQFDGELIFQYDSNGNLVRTIGAGTGATGRAGLAFDTAGNLYASSFGNDGFFSGSILKFDGSNDFAALGTFASGNGLAGANGLTFDRAGNLFVAGLLSQHVVKYPPSGGADSGSPFGDSVAYPSGMLLAEDGNLLVASLGNNNPADPIYGNVLFPGGVTKFDIATGETIGGGPFIRALGESLQGDYVDDELVDGLDLDAWQTAFGVDDSADSDSDHDSDGADFLAWQLNVGNLGEFQPTSIALYAGTLVVVSSVPEPSAVWLALLGTGSLCVAQYRIQQIIHR